MYLLYLFFFMVKVWYVLNDKFRSKAGCSKGFKISSKCFGRGEGEVGNVKSFYIQCFLECYVLFC